MMAFCAIFGIHSADIRGCCCEWDNNRPTHNEARQAGFSSSDILGLGSGQIWEIASPHVAKFQIRSSLVDCTIIAGKAEYEGANGTHIVLLPPKDINALSVICVHNHNRKELLYDPRDGVVDPTAIASLLCSRSVELTRLWNEESLTHALGDVLSDIVWIGRILADIEVQLEPFYHEATIGIVQRLYSSAVP